MGLLNRMLKLGKHLVKNAGKAANDVIDELETGADIEAAEQAHLERIRDMAKSADADLERGSSREALPSDELERRLAQRKADHASATASTEVVNAPAEQGEGSHDADFEISDDVPPGEPKKTDKVMGGKTRKTRTL